MRSQMSYGVKTSTRQHGRVPSSREGRRRRYIQRLSACPDAATRWEAFVERVAKHFDADDEIDRLLDAVVDAPAEAIALAMSEGGR